MYGFGIAGLILLGIVLFIMEILVIPGVGLAGIAGFIMIGFGVYLSYHHFGPIVGNFTLLGTIIFFAVSIIYSLRSKTWKKLTLETSIDSKVNVIEKEAIKVGDEGIAITRLAPMGKVKVNDQYVEGKSIGVYIEENSRVVVVKVTESNVIVKPINS